MTATNKEFAPGELAYKLQALRFYSRLVLVYGFVYPPLRMQSLKLLVYILQRLR